MKILAVILRYALALMFLYSGFLKVFNLQAFSEIVKNINLLPDVTDHPVVMIIPLLEIFLGFVLVLNLWTKPALKFIILLMAGFIVLITVSMLNKSYAGCGCFSFSRPATPWEGIYAILRDLVFIGISIFLLRNEKYESPRSAEND